MTGGRLAAIRHHLDPDEPFRLTYGDGVADIDVGALVRFHRAHGHRATITSVTPPGRFGALEFDGDLVTDFREKPAGDGARVNGGFFVADPSVLDLVDGPETVWESGPLEQLARRGELMGYRHDGFWQPMDSAARQDASRRDVADRHRPVEALVSAALEGAAGCSSRGIPASREAG